MVNLLVKLSPGDVQAMIAAQDYEAFRCAAANGHLDMVNLLVKLSPGDVQAMIAANNYAAFCKAASNGYLGMVNLLVALSPGNVQEMIAAQDWCGNSAFCQAATRGDLEMVNLLVKLAGDNVQEMIADNDYAAFREAARHGHLAVVHRLVELSPSRRKIQTMIAADDYAAFREAADNGQLAVVKYLVELSPSRREVQAMIAAGDYAAFREAVSRGDLKMVNLLIELAGNDAEAMIAAHDYKVFRYATGYGSLDVVNRLLSFPSVLAYRDLYESEYDDGDGYVHLFINDKLALLSKEIALAKQKNSSVVFDIADPEEAKLYFYVIRNLIRRNEPALLDNISLLLDIPAVRALAHKEVTPGMPNELLLLAMTTGNAAAASRLLTIPAIHDLAAQNNYYRDEMQGGLDLAELARDCESSMPALRVAEQLPEPKDTASNAGLASEAGFFANTSARQELEIGTTNSPRVTR